MNNRYAIIRIEKAKSMAAIKGKIDHILRNRETVNADPTKEITTLVRPPTFEEIQKRISSYMPRRNAVLAVEVIQTASPSFFKDKKDEEIFAWAEASLSWTQRVFGKEQVFCYCLHRDEQTCHCHAMVICEHENKLNATHYIGSKKKLRNLWSSYAEEMIPFGLVRGREYSVADHHKIKEYYANVNASYDELEQNMEKALGEIVFPKVTVKDRMEPQAYAERVIRDVVKMNELVATQLRKELEATRKDYDKLKTYVSDVRKFNKSAGENLRQLKEYKQIVRDLTRQSREAYQDGYAQAHNEGLKDREELERQHDLAYKKLGLEKDKMRYAVLQAQQQLLVLQNNVLQLYRTQVPANSSLRKANVIEKYFGEYPVIRDGVKGVLGTGNKVNTLAKEINKENGGKQS